MPTAPFCPRCAYDLSGETATWQRQCPLAGRCTECGLDFEWAHVASERLRPPPWSYEHAISRWPLRVPRTWCAACRPGRFWRTLRLEHPVRRTRLVPAVLLAITTLYLASGIAAMLAAARLDLFWSARLGGSQGAPGIFELAWREHRELLLAPFLTWNPRAGAYWRGPFGATWLASLGTVVLAFPLGMLLLPQTFRTVKVRRVHILRGFAHTLPVVAAFAMAGVLLAAWTEARVFSVGVRWGWLAAFPGIAWTTWAWHCIIRDYLRLPRAGAVWLAISLVALLATAVVAAIVIRDEMHILIWSWRL